MTSLVFYNADDLAARGSTAVNPINAEGSVRR